MVECMGISTLQRHILLTCLDHGGTSVRAHFLRFYSRSPKPPSVHDQVNAVTKALERLIDRELLVGYGVRTRLKWFIREVKLTPRGKRISRELLGKQQPLPFRK